MPGAEPGGKLVVERCGCAPAEGGRKELFWTKADHTECRSTAHQVLLNIHHLDVTFKLIEDCDAFEACQ